MCIAVPGKIEEIYEEYAMVNYGGVKVQVNILLIDNIVVGDYVLVHAGCAIEKLDEEYALETLQLFKELGEAIKGCEISGSSKRN